METVNVIKFKKRASQFLPPSRLHRHYHGNYSARFLGRKINASAPYHPTRKEYYTSKAKELGLPLPEFEESDDSGKVIDSSKLVAELGYKFIHVERI